ncbi:hypothetical protein D3C84_184660 [compost metagenome]|uniref:hypothetical protein n=1 Tax=Pseudomonas sp. ACN8 TaxID=1920428 RepID=UPI000BB3A0DE|nr:hypothetical protein [Pseudomonas sp. ACN8]PBJ21067.1 hypothetical protein BSF44_37540 [Pseudomonas sp. ACN8]
MTRWIQEFDQLPFKSSWTTLLEEVEPLDVDDQTVSTTVEELARLKKALAFVDGIIANSDIELTPKSIWQNCHGQTEACLLQVRAYTSNRNAAHLVQANEHADNLLTYVRPYMVAPEHALKAYGDAVRKFSDQITQYVGAFEKKAKSVQVDLENVAAEAVRQQKEIGAIELRAQQFDNYLYVGVEGNKPAETYIQEMVSDVEVSQKEVAALHQKLLDGPESTSEKISTFSKEIHQQRDALDELLDSATSRTKELERFYERIFGYRKGDDDEVPEDGLKQELDARLEQLGKHETEQKTRQEALFKSIESLLPGATSAGLASAYTTLKDHFKTPIIRYTRAFYGSMLILFLGGLALVTDHISLEPFRLEFVKTAGWEEMLRTLLTRMPIILPVVWVAIFSATRRSQYERLQQEYAHKEAFASSYESYKKQLEALQVDEDVLQKELIAKAIDAIAFNASNTLDGKHAEKPPVYQLLEKISIEDLKKILDLVKKPT